MGAGSSEPRSGDDRGQDSTEVDLITRLRELPPGPSPDAGFAAELRSQLVAIAPRIIAESASEVIAPSALRPKRRRGWLGAVRRPVFVLAGSAAVLVLLLGLAVWVSNGALPGQSLYGVKRAGEDLQLSLAGSNADKGRAYLAQATSRVKEAAVLAGSASGAPSPRTDALIADTLTDADADTRDGIQLLGKAAVDEKSAAPLSTVRSWATQQRERLAALRDVLPPGTARTGAQTSLTLVQAVAARASLLSKQTGCGCLSDTRTDPLGPVPCAVCVPITATTKPGSRFAPTRTGPPTAGSPAPTPS